MRPSAHPRLFLNPPTPRMDTTGEERGGAPGDSRPALHAFQNLTYNWKIYELPMD